MKMTPAIIFDHMRPNLTTAQVQALYKLMEQGANIDTIAEFTGVKIAPETTSSVSGYKLSETSLKRLEGVKKPLVDVVKRAIELSSVDFMVLEGVRSKEQAYINWGKGRTVAQLQAKGVPAKYAQPTAAKVTWLNNPLGSKHLTGDAVDLVPLPVDWNNLEAFDKVASAMLRAAKELGVSVTWGADWNGNGKPREKGETDSPHFEL